MRATARTVGMVEATRIVREVAAGHRLETQSLPTSGTHGRILAQDVAAASSTGEAADADTRPQGLRADPALHAGDVLTPPRVSLCASLGRATLQVSRRPTVAVFTIGEGPMEPGTAHGSARAQDSNRELLMGLLLADGLQPTAWPRLPANARQVEIALRDAGCAFDVILTCDVAPGDGTDHVAAVLDGFGRLHCQVAMAAAAPVLFGSLDQARLLAFPGDPGSIAIAHHTVGRTLIDALQGRVEARRHWRARLTLAVESDRFGCGYLYAHSHTDEHGAAMVRPLSLDGRSPLPAMAHANALVRLPETPSRLARGCVVEATAFP